MRKSLHAIVKSLVLCIAIQATSFAQEANRPFAIVELFTSEGCSTCPRADQFVSDLYDSYRAKDQAVYVLAFHVDYWDAYGWKDSFGKAEFSKRQLKYGAMFGLKSVYTPQLIINGDAQMPGFDPNAIISIEEALQRSAPVGVAMEFEQEGHEKVKVHCVLSRLPLNSVLNMAIVERGITRIIARGENSGRTLRHDNVVRSFKTVRKPVTDGHYSIELPSDIEIKNSAVIIYLQDANTLQIMGGASADLK